MNNFKIVVAYYRGARYAASEDGRIFSVYKDGSIKKELSQRCIHHNYKTVNIYDGSRIINTTVHRLVYYAFNQNAPLYTPDGKIMHVDHIDNNGSNNNLNNLQLLSSKENCAKRDINGNARNKAIEAFKDGVLVNTFNSGVEAARELNLDTPNICNVLKGKIKSTGGYTFKYKESKGN